MNADPATICRPGKYLVTVTFDSGTSERQVIIDEAKDRYDVFQVALVDMRMSSGAGLLGKVLAWNVALMDEQPIGAIHG